MSREKIRSKTSQHTYVKYQLLKLCSTNQISGMELLYQLK